MNATKRIQHLWFDFTDTLAAMDKAAAKNLVYTAYAEVTHKPMSPELVSEYEGLLAKHKSNSAIFVSLGLSGSFLSDRVNESSELYHLLDASIPDVINRLRERVPVSIFSNTRLDTILPALGIPLAWLTNRLGPDVVKNPKPALDGFCKMVELSGVPAGDILYIGDDVEKDLAPAKEVGMTTGLLWKQSDRTDYSFGNFQDILKVFS